MVFEQQPFLVGRIFYPGRSHGCYPVRATGGSLPCGRYLPAPFTGKKEGSKSLMVLRVKPTPTWFPPNSLYTPIDNTPLHSISSVCHPWGKGYWSAPFLCRFVLGKILISDLGQLSATYIRNQCVVVFYMLIAYNIRKCRKGTSGHTKSLLAFARSNGSHPNPLFEG